MIQGTPTIKTSLTTPRAAAIAGIAFSVLLIISLIIILIVIPPNLQDAEGLLSENWEIISLSLNLVPFAGIAFLWFIGVVRDRLGAHEDRFFATVFLGSGLLFLASLFTSAALTSGILVIYGTAPDLLVDSGIYTFGRAVSYEITNVYTIKMAGVFMITTCTLSLRTGILPRWMAFVGLALALFLLLSNGYIWTLLLFPIWILLISVHILLTNLRGQKLGNIQ